MKSRLTRIVTFVTSRLRGRMVLKFLQRYQSVPLVHRITRFFDPNYIRKVSVFHYQPKLAMLTWQGTRLWVDVNDHIGFRSFIRQEPFEMMVHTIATKIGITEGDVILDIGANIGTASVPICRETGCELAAIEASKDTASLLLKNIALNQIKAHVDIVALTSQADDGAFLKLYLRDGNRGANSLLADWNPSKADATYELAPATTLDRYIDGARYAARIALIKIDVEGAELDVIKGGQKFLASNTAPILMEYRVDAGAKVRDMLAQALDLMAERYDVFGLDTAGNKTMFDPTKPYENILFEPKTQGA